MKRRGPTQPRPWEPLHPSELEPGGADAFVAAGLTPPDEVWGSPLFSVMVRYARNDGGVVLPRSELLWLSIHRRDRKPIRDWRHMQAIKNEVAGPDRVAVEVYPAEADVVDTSNEYHLWVMPAGLELPFGFGSGGLLMGPEDATVAAARARQREWQLGIPTGRGKIAC